MDQNEKDLTYPQWESNLTQILGFAQGKRVTSSNAHTFIRLFLEGTHSRQVRFLSNDLHRTEMRIAIRTWECDPIPLSELKRRVNNGDNTISIRKDSVLIDIVINKFGSGYTIRTPEFAFSMPVNQGEVPNVTDEKIAAMAKLNNLCKELNYAHL